MYYAKDRKNQHLDLAKFQFESEIEFNSLESIELPYCALPEIDFSSVNLETDFFLISSTVKMSDNTWVG